MKEISVIRHDDSGYPKLLREIPDPPRQLYCRGVLPDDGTTKIAIVGTRKATEAGKSLARTIGEAVSRRGIIVVSGLAFGIDAAAHEGALRGGSPTIAVLGGNINTYPGRNEHIAEQILKDGGALLAEDNEDLVQPYHFLRRNRIVSGLSAATIIIEAPERSGSLATARAAAEQGRDVFVFPGPVSHPNYRGSHALIRDGARLVGSLDDVFTDMGISNVYADLSHEVGAARDNPHEDAIVKALESAGAPLSIDKLVLATKLEPQVVAASLTMLTLQSVIKETERGYTL